MAEVNPVTFTLTCVGCQHRPDACVYALDMGETVNDHLTMVPEPENPYDSDAIAIMVDDQLLGYIPKDRHVVARRFLALVKEAGEGAKVVWDIKYVQWESRDLMKWFEFTVRLDGSER